MKSRLKSQLFGLLAHPVSHSLSPQLYRQWFSEYHMNDAKFELFDVRPEKLADFMKKMRAFSSEAFSSGSKTRSNFDSRIVKISGLAVSIPHKEAVMQYLDEIDPIAAEIGAVNTICVQSAKLKGWNTDWIGVLESFREAHVSLRDKRVLILGAGGAARAAVYACMKEGAHVVIANRTYEKAETLAVHFRCSVIAWDDRESAAADIIINTTSVGLEDPESSPVSRAAHHFPRQHAHDCVAFDFVYRPRMTKFLRDATHAGLQIITGDRMLYFQGKAQFNLLTGFSAG